MIFLEKILSLKINNIFIFSDEGLKYIPNIQELDIYHNTNITDRGLSFIPLY